VGVVQHATEHGDDSLSDSDYRDIGGKDNEEAGEVLLKADWSRGDHFKECGWDNAGQQIWTC